MVSIINKATGGDVNLINAKKANSTMDTDAASAASTAPAPLTASGKPKEKRRNNEKRKEKSRDAARCRRSRETEIFTELAQALPLQENDINQLDKASVMRIAIAYLKIREMLQLFPKIEELTGAFKIDADNITDVASSPETIQPKVEYPTIDYLKCAETSQLIKQTLDGFLIILSNDGDITYASENIVDYLGITKIDILGQQIWEYSHQCDHAELKEALNIKRNGIADKIKDENILDDNIATHHRDLFVRLKCTLTSRGRSINIKSASYKVIHITGHLVVNGKGDRVFVAIGRPIPHPSNIEIPLGTTTFLTKHSLDMKFTYVDDKMYNLLGYKSENLLEKSLFGCHHGGDSDRLMATFKSVLSKGQCETCRYRFLGKTGGYCWLVTQATIVYDKLKPQSVVCVNYVISNLENKNEIYSLAQYEAASEQKQQEQTQSDEENNNTNIKSNNNSNNNDTTKIIECEEQKASDKPEIILPTSITSKTSSFDAHIPNDNQIEVIETLITTEPIAASTTATTTTTSPSTTITPTLTTTPILNTELIVIKHEKSPAIKTNTTITNTPQQIPPATIIEPTTTTTPILNDQSVITPVQTAKSLIREESSLAPLRRSLQTNCLIGFNKPKTTIEEKRPKSVTASVIRSTTDLPILSLNNSASSPTTGTTQLLPPLNTTTRAQSVTASVFTPLSQLTNKNYQQYNITKSLTNAADTTASGVAAVIPTTTSTAAILGQQAHQQSTNQQKPQQDMNKFLSFADDVRELTMLKEEPDDLSHHLATTAAVDACLPLDESSPFGEMLVGLMGSYSSLLPDDINSLDSTTAATAVNTTDARTATTGTGTTQNCNNNNNNYRNSNNTTTATINGSTTTGNRTNNNNNNTSNIDPFINYREESNDTNCSQHLLSPSVTSKSPEASSLPSLCSPNSLSQGDDDFAFCMTMNVDEDIDLTMRAPYIPMNEQDDLPLLTDDLMWCSSNAFTAEELNIHKDGDAIQQLQLHHLQQHQQQQQQSCDNNRLYNNAYQQLQQQQLINQQQQQQQQQQHFSNSLCSSPASTVSSLPPSPVQHLQAQQQQPTAHVFATDSSELAALLCGTGNGTLSILANDGNTDGGSLVISSGGVGGGVNQQQQQRSNVDFRLQQLQHELQLEEQHQQRQQHQHLLGLSIDCKKEKYDASLAPSLCDSIDAFDNVYHKDSTNLDCWNELLQINVNDTTTSTCASTPDSAAATTQLEDCKQHILLSQQQQHQQQQNIILNAVPLITIQSNKNLMMSQQQQQQQQEKVQELLLPTLSRSTNNNNNNSNNNSNNSGNNSQSKVSTIKLLNTPITTKATIRLIESKALQQHQQQQQQQRLGLKATILQQQQQQQQHHGNKRHLNNQTAAANPVETKRLKSGTMSVDLQSLAAPQLLQQLIGKDQQQKRAGLIIGNSNNNSNQRWINANADTKQNGQKQLQQQQQQQQQSNSVLKNLLISGCDNELSDDPEPMLIDEDSLEQMNANPPSSTLLNVDVTACCLPYPLRCQATTTSTANVLRNYRHNPLIGGPGILPSPPFAHIDDSIDHPPGLTAPDTDSASDSGIDDISNGGESGGTSPIKHSVNGNNETVQDSALILECVAVHPNIPTATTIDIALPPPPLPPLLETNIGTSSRSNGNRSGGTMRKSSISFMDSSNPLLTPFLMDLCNDDYNMNSNEYPFEDNELEQVLNGDWTQNIV